MCNFNTTIARACARPVSNPATLLSSLQAHVGRTRTKVLRNTERLRKRDLAAGGKGLPHVPADDDGSAQDQGFCRPKALVLLPTRGFACRWVERMLHLLPEAQGRGDSVSKRDRLEKEFGVGEDLDEVEALRLLKCAPADGQRVQLREFAQPADNRTHSLVLSSTSRLGLHRLSIAHSSPSDPSLRPFAAISLSCSSGASPLISALCSMGIGTTTSALE